MTDILADLPRGNGKNMPPQAMFEPLQAIRAAQTLLFRPEKIFLGMIDGRIVEEQLLSGRMTRYAHGGQLLSIDSDMHHMVISATRGSKGRASLIPNLLTNPSSIVAIDVKGELASITARIRSQKLNNRIIILDGFNIVGAWAKEYCNIGTFDPLSILTETAEPSPTLVEDAGLIADSLIVSEVKSDDHWDEAAKGWLEAVLLHTATFPGIEHRDLVTTRDFIMGRHAGLLEDMSNNTSASGAIIDAVQEMEERPRTERGNVISTLRRHLRRFLSYEAMQQVFRGPSINLRELKSGAQPTTIYLVLPATRLSTCFRFFRVMISLVLRAIEMEQTRRHNVLLCLDEMPVLRRQKDVETAIGAISGFGAKLLMYIQDLGQLKAIYPESYQTFLGNCETIQAYHNNDLETLNWLSQRLGDTSILAETTNTLSVKEQTRQGRIGFSETSRSQRLLTPEECSRFFSRDDEFQRQLIIRLGHHPMVIQRAYYDKIFDDFDSPNI